MSADPVSEPVRHADDDLPGRLGAIDQRLHQISTHLATLGTLLCQLDETRTNLETLIRSLESAGPIVAGAACELPGCGARIMNSGRRLSLPQRPPVEHDPLTEAPGGSSRQPGPVQDTRYPAGSDG